MGKRDMLASAPVIAEGVMASELFADFALTKAGTDVVKIWFYSDQSNPLSPEPMRIPIAILTMPTAAFDLFLADLLAARAAVLSRGTANHNGNHSPQN